MAQRLHTEYGYSYDNLKVLLGGWNAWLEKNASDPTGYPIATGAAAKPTIAIQEPLPTGTQVTP